MKEKLVRDKIPQIIQGDGKTPVVRVASGVEIESLLIEKLKEETKEFEESKSSEELADILQVVYAVAEFKNLSKVDLEVIRRKKAEDRGGFNKRIILQRVEEH